MASTSLLNKQSPLPIIQPNMSVNLYPDPEGTYERAVRDSGFFMASLERLHTRMGTKYMIPIIGGRELDLHRLFVEVTKRGGLAKVVKERKWKEITSLFNFPATATNASFVLRKYYISLLYHYEQLYYFRLKGFTPDLTDSVQSPRLPAQVTVQPSPEYQAATALRQRTNTAELCGAKTVSSGDSQVIGVIDGKFESGYLVTVSIGSQKLKGVLYQAPHDHLPQQYNVPVNNSGNVPPVLGTRRRRRRKKSEIKRRDPNHPKPNRSGYNFFFAEQHAELKPRLPGKDRDISRIIGERWKKMKDSEREMYQEMAIKDKERYRIEMEDYRERLKTGQVVRDAVPLKQFVPGQDSDMAGAEAKTDELEGEDSLQTPDNESSSDESDSEFEDEDKTTERDLNVAAESLKVHSDNMRIDSSAEAAFDLSK